jgi:hypothetical protein
MDEITYVQEIGVGHKEFFRVLPKAMWSPDYRVDCVRVDLNETPGKRFRIDIGPEKRRRLSVSLSMPSTRVVYTFRGYSREETERLMAHINRHFMRGGG